MKVLVINAGSSSLKYQLIDMETEKVIAKGNCEKIGIGGFITHKTFDGRVIEMAADFPTHAEAFMKLKEVLTSGEGKVIEDMNEVSAVGHRIVQGADRFTESVLVTDQVVDTIEEIAPLAPLHNYAHALAIRACQKVLSKDVPQVVVFDTAFHSTMPEKAFMFAIPYEYYEKDHIRRYGFHGTSHRYVSQRLAKLLNKKPEELKIVTCHIGNGSSVTAVDGGRSVDTSMGFTPLDGVLMGTRSGGIDPSVVAFISEKEGIAGKELSEFLNKKCGYLGISGITSDDRDLRKAASEGNRRAKLAGTMLRYQIKKFIGAYAAAMGGLDAVIFTGGIGENSVDLRREVCENMEFFGIKVDENKNIEFNGKEQDISAEGAKVRTWIVPTNEELTIARDTVEIVNRLKK